MYISKITPKVLGINEADKSFVVAGYVGSTEVIQTTYGNSIKFRGDFSATVEGQDTVFESSVMFAPAILEDYLSGHFDAAEAQVMFVVRVSTITDTTLKSGYRYGLDILTEGSESPSEKLLRDTLGAKL